MLDINRKNYYITKKYYVCSKLINICKIDKQIKIVNYK